MNFQEREIAHLDFDTNSLEEIEIDPSKADLPERVQAWLDFTDRKSTEWYACGLGEKYPRHTMSDPEIVSGAITFLKKEGYLPGDRFCEWGSGLGVAAGTAAILGMNAVGIEREPELAEKASALADEFGIPATYFATSFLPEGFEETEGIGGKDLLIYDDHLSRERSALSTTIEGIEYSEIDLFFIYPWPDQEEMILQLFEFVASPDAILLMYLGDGEIAGFLKY